MKVIFTDLDGTLLQEPGKSFAPALPALGRVREQAIPLVFCTSKTRAEVEVWRRALRNRDPFIVENGGAIYVPSGYFSHSLPYAVRRDGYVVVELGTSHGKLLRALDIAASRSRCSIRSFHRASPAELAERFDLPLEHVHLAKKREYDEPFEILDEDRAPHLLREIENQGLRWMRGGRLFHITGGNDKGFAVRLLAGFFRQSYGELTTIGLGDGPNDLEMLRAVHIPVVIDSPLAHQMREAIPQALAGREGPAGWNEALLTLLANGLEDSLEFATTAGLATSV
jgi:mannosyl-3-phosphoglycerate phosphatase